MFCRGVVARITCVRKDTVHAFWIDQAHDSARSCVDPNTFFHLGNRDEQPRSVPFGATKSYVTAGIARASPRLNAENIGAKAPMRAHYYNGVVRAIGAVRWLQERH